MPLFYIFRRNISYSELLHFVGSKQFYGYLLYFYLISYQCILSLLTGVRRMGKNAVMFSEFKSAICELFRGMLQGILILNVRSGGFLFFYVRSGILPCVFSQYNAVYPHITPLMPLYFFSIFSVVFPCIKHMHHIKTVVSRNGECLNLP